ncbi:MAG: radical SAM family heme chaperone HemW, partial [Eubacteriales bacterium]|nr:radical SAM family heme chaperone HemW [Eubacteriales bacterium]
KAYRKAGINRISMGLQCWQTSLLKTLGRIHSARDFEISLDSARREGFSNINADLIFGIPGQTEADWIETLNKIIALELPHISCYSLSIEQGTELGIMRDRGELVELDDEIDRAMYHYAESRLMDEGYRHYEISNFSKPGYECLHNLVYWRCGEYLGLGAGAHSYIDGVRYSNVNEIKQYIETLNAGGSPAENHEAINIDEQKSEYMIVGLRTGDGINLTDFKNKFGQEIDEVYGDQIEQLVERGLLIKNASRIHLTELGLDLANQVFIEFI